jgi:holin-like protein
MIFAFLLLIACELVGEVVRQAFNLAIPGPVIGMFILAAVLAFRKHKPDAPAIPDALGRTAETLINHMGLLFVPAGVGIITEAGLLRQEWLPIAAGLIGSTVLSLIVTGLVMHWTARPRGKTQSPALPAARPGLAGHQGRAP